MKPYLIRSPQFDVTSGGIRVLYGLYGHLLAKGQVAYLNSVVDIDAIAIYPEIFHGNDMMGKKVVRYVLQEAGRAGTDTQFGKFTLGPKEFDKTDEIYCFSKIYDKWGLPDDHILFLPIINMMEFRDFGKKRTKTAFYAFRDTNLKKHPEDAIEITREMAKDQSKLAEILNECQTLYVYDEITAMLEVARLCGVNIEYWGRTPLETFKSYEPGLNGIGYRTSAELDTKGFRRHYEDLRRTFDLKLDQFITDTQHD
jgi:hypothetical protein